MPPASLLLSALLFLAPARADEVAASWSALRVSLNCETFGRVDACTYVRGFLDASPLFRVVPRAEDQVRLVLAVTIEADEDIILLRFVSEEQGLPPSYELLQRVDSRAAVDEQRAELEPAFLRGMAVYLARTNPAAVSVALRVPDGVEKAPERTTPWGISLWLGGWGSWTSNYQSLSTWSGGSVYRITNTSQLSFAVDGSFDLSREPSLNVKGHTVSLDTDAWSASARLFGERHLSPVWSIGGVASAGMEDPQGQFASSYRAEAGVSRDWFPSDDPRGNSLSLTYLVGVHADTYNSTNEIGEDAAIFPVHGLLATGSVHKDKTEFSLDLSAGSQLNAPLRRYTVGAEGDITLTLGDHVDVYLSFGVTKQAIPGPAYLDASDYEAVTRGDYAEPLSVYGDFNLNIHWSNTNGARNNRFDAVSGMSPLGNL